MAKSEQNAQMFYVNEASREKFTFHLRKHKKQRSCLLLGRSNDTQIQVF